MSGLFLLVATATLSHTTEHTIEFIYENRGFLGGTQSTGVLFLIVAALLIKIPTGPFYHWLLKAHVEASTAGSILLAAIMLKIPFCALLRILVSAQQALHTSVLILILTSAVFTVVVCSAQLWQESDIKRVVALSSVVHMGGTLVVVVVSGVSDYIVTIPAVLVLTTAHSFSSAAMFAVAGMISARYHTRDIFQVGGIFISAPRIGSFF